MSKLVGYKTRSSAWLKAVEVSTNPEVCECSVGWVALGDVLLLSDGRRTRLAYGAAGTSADISTVEGRGL